MDLLSAFNKAKLVLKKEGKDEEINCMFNPSQYAVKNNVNYKEEHSLGTDMSRMVFISGGQSELSLTLYFDSMGEPGRLSSAGAAVGMAASVLSSGSLPPVTDTTKKITAAMRVSGTEHRPPLVAFKWGNLNFQGVVTSMTETFTMFDMSGKPIRSKVDLTIRADGDEKAEKMKEPFESPDRTKCRTVIEGMSLWSLAWDEYGDCGKWREIARANGIKNPLAIYPGQILKVPAL